MSHKQVQEGFPISITLQYSHFQPSQRLMFPSAIKAGVPSKPTYGLNELSNEAELSVWLYAVEATLRPCPKCGSTDVRVAYYFAIDDRIHCFWVECLTCQIQTRPEASPDSEEGFKSALFQVFAVWNRCLSEPNPQPPFSFQNIGEQFPQSSDV